MMVFLRFNQFGEESVDVDGLFILELLCTGLVNWL